MTKNNLRCGMRSLLLRYYKAAKHIETITIGMNCFCGFTRSLYQQKTILVNSDDFTHFLVATRIDNCYLSVTITKLKKKQQQQFYNI